jgi:hypothetical protein
MGVKIADVLIALRNEEASFKEKMENLRQLLVALKKGMARIQSAVAYFLM